MSDYVLSKKRIFFSATEDPVVRGKKIAGDKSGGSSWFRSSWFRSSWFRPTRASPFSFRFVVFLSSLLVSGLCIVPDRLYASSGDLGGLIRRVAGEERVDVALLRAIVDVESDYRTGLVSEKGAVGLMQLMPATARAMGVTNRRNPEQSLRAGARYIKRLMDLYPSMRLALAAYNAGPGNVDKFGGIPPFPETQSYVRRVMAKYAKEARIRKTAEQAATRTSTKNSLNSRKRPVDDRKNQVQTAQIDPQKVVRIAGNSQGPGAYGILQRTSYLASVPAADSETFKRNGSRREEMTITEVPILRLTYD